MFVESLLPAARERLATIADDAPLIDAARLLRAGTDILVVCSAGGLLRGVITKTDVVAQISRCQGAGCVVYSSVAMTQDGHALPSRGFAGESVAPHERTEPKKHSLVDQELQPLGEVTARDMLQAMLRESTTEEAMMRDYVMGFGYR